MTVSRDKRKRLTRLDWINAAKEYGQEFGFENLAIEPLAARIGATKGSFYWHFADQPALLDAVMAEWEDKATRQVIEQIEHTAQAADQQDELDHLFRLILSPHPDDGAEWKLIAAASHPQIGPAVVRVHGLRIDYVAARLRARGLSTSHAHERARFLYAAYVGHLLLTQSAPGLPEVSASGLRELFLAAADGGGTSRQPDHAPRA